MEGVDRLAEIKARMSAAKMWQGGVAPYSTGSGIDPYREFQAHAEPDMEWLIAEVERLRKRV